MQAKVTNPAGYRCAPNGAIVVVFPFGEVISGQVAEWADIYRQRPSEGRQATGRALRGRALCY